jgi:DNA gyrase subunit A
VPKEQGDDHKYILLCTVQGIVKKTPMLDCAKIRVTGVRAITLDEDDSLISARVTNGNQELFFTSRNGMALRVHESTIRPMGRTARGVIGIRLKQGDRVVSAIALSGSGRLLTVTEKGYGKKTRIDDYAIKKHRGNFGMRCMNVTEKNGPVVNTLEVEEHFQIFIITQQGKLIRTPVSGISTVGRVTQGNRLFHIAEDDIVIDVASMIEDDEEELPENGEAAAVPENPVAETQTELAETVIAEAPETVTEALQDALPLEDN